MVSAQLQGIHAALASMTNEPLLALGDMQAALLGNAVAEASRHYNFAPDGKVMSLIGLAGAAMIVYVPMFGAIRMKRTMAQRQAQASGIPPTPEEVVIRENRGTMDFTALNI